MRWAALFTLVKLSALVLVGASVELPLGDAERGKQAASKLECVGCHSVRSEGGRLAGDLSNSVTRGFNPSTLAALIWNSVPAKRELWRQQPDRFSQMSEQNAADLFVYLYVSRRFEEPGNSHRGERLFRTKFCSKCHGLIEPLRPDAPPVSRWAGPGHPVLLAQQMWSHADRMRAALTEARIAFPRLAPAEMADLLAYFRSVLGQPEVGAAIDAGSPEKGREILRSAGCRACHAGSRSIEARPTRLTMQDLASSLWNHPPVAGKAKQAMSYEEMRHLMGYLIATQFQFERGDPAKGRRLYESKRCAACHDRPASGAPPREAMAGRMNSFAMIAAVWTHAGGMLKLIDSRRQGWPRISPQEMADLTAYLNGYRLRRRQASTPQR